MAAYNDLRTPLAKPKRRRKPYSLPIVASACILPGAPCTEIGFRALIREGQSADHQARVLRMIAEGRIADLHAVMPARRCWHGRPPWRTGCKPGTLGKQAASEVAEEHPELATEMKSEALALLDDMKAKGELDGDTHKAARKACGGKLAGGNWEVRVLGALSNNWIAALVFEWGWHDIRLAHPEWNASERDKLRALMRAHGRGWGKLRLGRRADQELAQACDRLVALVRQEGDARGALARALARLGAEDAKIILGSEANNNESAYRTARASHALDRHREAALHSTPATFTPPKTKEEATALLARLTVESLD